MTTYAIAGATGQLGRKVLDEVINRVGAKAVVALARDPARLSDAASLGVTVREADYNQPETLEKALVGVDRLLLISGNAIGQRVAQHGAVIEAAKAAGVSFIAYTSVLHADASTLGLAAEHRETEALLRASGVPHALLRNGWYSENYTGGLGAALATGTILGSSGEGRISAATRADLAAAAAVVLTGDPQFDGATLELAGDEALTMAAFAAEVARQSGKAIVYGNLSREDYAKALESVGLPDFVAAMIAGSSFEASKDMLFDDSHTLSRLIGRPTTPIAASIAAGLG